MRAICKARTLSLWATLAAAAALALALAPAAAADRAESSNWAGYAVHHAHVHFKKVLGTWRQPKATCRRGRPTYSSVWVGLGGFSARSRALEQIGTEADCTAGGHQSSTAWYELVPAASHTIRLRIRAGDRVRASVAVSGRRVRLVLANLTRHRSFAKRVRASVLDTGSAEWIVEAPSVCSAGKSCRTLPLTNFGSARFTAARAQSRNGHIGRVRDRRWKTTRILLAQGGRRFISTGKGSRPTTAIPSVLSPRHTAFTVTYRGSPGAFSSANTRQVAAARLVHAPAPAP